NTVMKNKLIAILILLSLVLRNPIDVRARTGNESAITERNITLQAGTNEATVTFAELGFQETSLVSPFDSTRVLFSIPANWRLAAGGELSTEYDITLSVVCGGA